MGQPRFSSPLLDRPRPGGSTMGQPRFSSPLLERPRFGGPLLERPRFGGPLLERPRFSGPLLEHPRFDGPRSQFENQRFDGPRSQLESQRSDGPFSKMWGTGPRGLPSERYNSPLENLNENDLPGGLQWRGPAHPVEQEQLFKESLAMKKEPVSDISGSQHMAHNIPQPLSTLGTGTASKHTDSSLLGKDLNRSHLDMSKPGIEAASGSLQSQSYRDAGKRVQEVKPTEQQPPVGSSVPPTAQSTVVSKGPPTTENKNLKSKDANVPQVEEQGMGPLRPSGQEKGPLRQSSNEEKGLIKTDQTENSRGRGRRRQQASRGRGRGRSENNRERSPLRPGVRDRSPLRTDVLERSPPRLAFLDRSPPRLAFLDRSPPRLAFLDRSPPRLGFLERSPPRLGFLERSPPRLGFLERSPPRLGFRDRSPPRMGFRDRSPPRMGFRDRSPLRLQSDRDKDLEERPLIGAGPETIPPLPPWRHGEIRVPVELPLDVRGRSDLSLERERLAEWERERYWRQRDLEFRGDSLELYNRDERLPLHSLVSTAPSEIDRKDPWWDELERTRERNRDREHERNLDRFGRPYDFYDLDLRRDYIRSQDDRDFLRDQDYPPLPPLPALRPLSPLRPRSPLRSLSPHSSLPPLPPLPPLEDRLRDERDLFERDRRERGELRIHEYPERLDEHREERDRGYLSENVGWDAKSLEDRWYLPADETRERLPSLEGQQDPLPLQTSALPERETINPEPSSMTGMMILSQRQHEIILKAAQELKVLREQKENREKLKQLEPESQPSEQLLKLPIMEDDISKSVDFQASRLAVPAGSMTHQAQEPQKSVPVPGTTPKPTPDVPAGKLEQTHYGERFMLHPDSCSDKEKGLREHYERERDTFFHRQGNKSMDHREFEKEKERERDRDREREMYRDRERERSERDRLNRENRIATGPRPSFHDGKDHSSNRRGSFDRPTRDRKLDRPVFEQGPSLFGGERRGYPEERMPMPVSHQPPIAPRVEKKPETKNVDDLLKPPGRESRPERIVVIMRGLPGSGKTHVAKLIRDKEVECGGAAPRVLSLDDYFITEVEKVEKDPDTGKKVQKKVMEYEYEPEMEETYRSSMFKTFRKTLDDGFFPFIILDAINDRVRHFEQFWSAAKTKGFEVYLAEMSADNQTCVKRNIHNRKLKEINKMADNWETAPRHMMRLDIRSLLQDAAIEEVEMEDSEPNIEEQREEIRKEPTEEEESDLGYIPKSKWEMDTSEAKLDKLDGLKIGSKRKHDVASRIEDYLQLPDDYESRASEPGKKRVRWADLEEKKDADRKRAIGFVVGQTDWEKITDESGHLAERALNRTKYI